MSSTVFRFAQDPQISTGEEQRRYNQRLRVLSFVRVGILILLLLAFALRTFRLDAQSLWYDEGVTAEVAQRSFEELTEWTARDVQPPLYYQVVAGWGRMAGWSEWSLRFPSLFFGMLTLPLLYLVALRLTRSRTAAAVTILFAALHPLLIYYSQEARMYAQLVALSVLAAYFLLLVAVRGVENAWLWAGYVVAATAAIYTHYFAFFLLLALGIAFCTDLLLSSRPPENRYPFPLLRNFALINVLVLFLYLPWINVMFSRLAIDTSYWQGRFKVWEALRAIAISFVAGETMRESNAIPLLPAVLVLTLLSVLILGRRFIRGIPSPLISARVLLYPLLWLILPISVILLLASFVPKFNSRYVMIALPGLLILWSSALATLLDPFFIRLRRENLDRAVDELGRPITLRHSIFGAIALAICIFFFAIFLRSSINWFTDPAFTKSQWRELASYLHANRQESEPVLLVSGHAWPIWNYYAPDIPAQRLPDIEILDVNSALGFGHSASLLDSAFGGGTSGAKPGEKLAAKHDAWLISWQDEVVDPMNLVPLHLQLAGHEQQVDAQFWQLGLRHFTEIDPKLIQSAPPAMLEQPFNFGDQLALVAYSLLENGDLVLYWQSQNPDSFDADLHITLETFTGENLPYYSPKDQRPAGYFFPTFRWQKGQFAVGQISASDWVGAGAISGTYRVSLGVYDPQGDVAGLDIVGDDGQLLGKRAWLDLTLDAAVSPAPIGDLVALSKDLSASISLNADTVEAGQTLFADVWWSAADAKALEVVWRDSDDESKIARTLLPFDGKIAPNTWQPGDAFHTVQKLQPPDEVTNRPGRYLVDFQAPGSDGDGDGRTIRKELDVLQNQREFDPPPLATSVGAPFGNELILLGFKEPLPQLVTPSSELPATAYWQVMAQATVDYTLTVQWLDSDGNPVRQTDQPLVGGSSTWLVDEVVGQRLVIPTPVQPGTYELILAVYNAGNSSFSRLVTVDGRDFVSLGMVEVE